MSNNTDKQYGAQTRMNKRARKAFESAQERVVGNDRVRSLNTGNRDVSSDDVNNSVDTRKIILRVKPERLIRLKSVTAGTT